MARFQHGSDGIQDAGERGASALKCIGLLLPFRDNMDQGDQTFFDQQVARKGNVGYTVSMPQLNWLRDMVERYAS